MLLCQVLKRDFFRFCSFNLMLLGEKIKAVLQMHVCADVTQLCLAGAALTGCQWNHFWQRDASALDSIQKFLYLWGSRGAIEWLIWIMYIFKFFCMFNKLSPRCRVCPTNSILLSSVFIQLLPDLWSAYCPCSPVGPLSLEQGLFLIGRWPSVPTGVGGDGMGGGGLSLIAFWTDSNTDPSSQKKQNHDLFLRGRFTAWWGGWNSFFEAFFQWISINMHINISSVSPDCACCCRV